jgi:hypothetical protein
MKRSVMLTRLRQKSFGIAVSPFAARPAYQIVGREWRERERLAHPLAQVVLTNWSGDARLNSRGRVDSGVGPLTSPIDDRVQNDRRKHAAADLYSAYSDASWLFG